MCMYVCTLARMYVCTYVCTYVRIYVCTYVCMLVCITVYYAELSIDVSVYLLFIFPFA